MTVRLIVRVTNYAETAPLATFKTIEVQSTELERLLGLDYGNRAHAEVIGAELLPEVCGNCDTALPEGCGGQFKDDGTSCALNRARAALPACPEPDCSYPSCGCTTVRPATCGVPDASKASASGCNETVGNDRAREGS